MWRALPMRQHVITAPSRAKRVLIEHPLPTRMFMRGRHGPTYPYRWSLP